MNVEYRLIIRMFVYETKNTEQRTVIKILQSRTAQFHI